MLNPFSWQDDFGLHKPCSTSINKMIPFSDFVNMLVSFGFTAHYVQEGSEILKIDPHTVYVELGKLQTDITLVGKNGIDIVTLTFRDGGVSVNGL